MEPQSFTLPGSERDLWDATVSDVATRLRRSGLDLSDQEFAFLVRDIAETKVRHYLAEIGKASPLAQSYVPGRDGQEPEPPSVPPSR